MQFSSEENLSNEFSKNTPAIIIQNDSVIVSGQSLLQAFDRLEVAEFSAKSLIMSKPLGELVPIGSKQIQALREKFLGNS